MRIRKIKGFTLLEVVIVMAIIALIAAFALPAYDKQMLKTRRADAKTALLALAQLQETFNMNNANMYASTLIGEGSLNCERKGICKDDGGVAKSPEGYYTLTVTDLDSGTEKFDAGFILTATIAAGSIQDDKWEKAQCQFLSINSRGMKTATSTNCW